MDYHSVYFFISILARTNAVLLSVTCVYNFVHKFQELNICITKNLTLLVLILAKKKKTPSMGHYFLGSPHIEYSGINLEMCDPSFHSLYQSHKEHFPFSIKFRHENNVAHLLLNSYC
jgi:hypothetical protein